MLSKLVNFILITFFINEFGGIVGVLVYLIIFEDWYKPNRSLEGNDEY